MSISEKSIRESLDRHAPGLRSYHDILVGGFRKDGLIDDGALHASSDADADVNALAAAAGKRQLSPLQAHALSQNTPNLQRVFAQVRARASRYGITFGDDPLSVANVDAKLKAANVNLDERMAFKSALHTLRLI